MYAQARGALSLVALALLVGWGAPAGAAEIRLTLEWTEPLFEAVPDYPDSMLRFTRIRWSPEACLNQPPPGIREELRGTWTYCGFYILKDVPANTPAGGEVRTTELVIPDANLAWPKIWVLLHFFYGNGHNYHAVQDQVVVLVRTPTGDMVRPPTALGVSR